MADQPSKRRGIMSYFQSFIGELCSSPLNLGLLGICAFLLYKIISGRRKSSNSVAAPPPLPQLPKKDYTLAELKAFDGNGPDKRVLVAVNAKVFDVTRGSRFYGPGGPYAVFAGRDASRGLATFSLGEESLKDGYDDLSDLDTMQMDSVREWEMQFTEKYDFVGKLLKPGESPTDYSEVEGEKSKSD